MVEFVKATIDHIAPIAQTMRSADCYEVWASSLSRPDEALKASLDLSPLAWTALVDDRPICMFGAAAVSTLSKRAIPWFLASTEIERHKRDFLQLSQGQLQAMLAQFPILANYVDARNAAAIRWLKWMGFTLKPATPHGPFNLPFHPFEMRSASHV